MSMWQFENILPDVYFLPIKSCKDENVSLSLMLSLQGKPLKILGKHSCSLLVSSLMTESDHTQCNQVTGLCCIKRHSLPIWPRAWHRSSFQSAWTVSTLCSPSSGILCSSLSHRRISTGVTSQTSQQGLLLSYKRPNRCGTQAPRCISETKGPLRGPLN